MKKLKLLIIVGFLIPMSGQAQVSDILYGTIGVSEEYQVFHDYALTFPNESSNDFSSGRFATIAYLGAWYQPSPVLGVRANIGYAMLFGPDQRKQLMADIRLIFDISPVWNYDSNFRLLVLSGPMYYYIPPMGDNTRGNALGIYLGLEGLSQKSHFAITPYGKIGFNRHGDLLNSFGITLSYFIGRIDTWNP